MRGPPTRVNVNTALSPSVMASGAMNDTSGSSSRTVTAAESSSPRSYRVPPDSAAVTTLSSSGSVSSSVGMLMSTDRWVAVSVTEVGSDVPAVIIAPLSLTVTGTVNAWRITPPVAVTRKTALPPSSMCVVTAATVTVGRSLSLTDTCCRSVPVMS